MKQIVIRQLQEKDIDFVYEMTVAENWNDRIEDVKRMLSYEPNGCFMAEVENKPAGHIFTVTYETSAWIGLLIVKKEYRRMKIGTLLMEKAKDYLKKQDVKTIKLEAIPEIANLYRKHGFTDECDSLRFKTTSKSVLFNDKSITRTKQEEIETIAKFDAKYFGAKRTRILQKLRQENPKLCFTSHENNEINGYIMRRKAKSGYKIGPWVCNPQNPQPAKNLLLRCMKEIEPESQIYIGVPAPNSAAIKILKEHGFEQHAKSIRMHFGKQLSECIEGVFGIGGPMKG